LGVEAVLERPRRRVDHAVETHELVHLYCSPLHTSVSLLSRSRASDLANGTPRSRVARRHTFRARCPEGRVRDNPEIVERKLVTVLFADLVGSTALADEQDP